MGCPLQWRVAAAPIQEADTVRRVPGFRMGLVDVDLPVDELHPVAVVGLGGGEQRNSEPMPPTAPAALPLAPSVSSTAGRAEYERLARRVKLLSWLSLGWMTIEGAVAIIAGIVAGSIALIGFGIDSAIEGLASVIIIWRFSGARMFSAKAETRAQKLVALQFFVLAPYVGVESIRALLGGEHADVSWVGIGLSIGSVIIMPLLGIAKQRLADQLGSAATKGEGRQNMLCAYLAGALLVGLLGNALVGAWWLDPTVGLLIAAVAVREGLEAWRGDGCCVASPLE
ncbi:MAG: cation transporter [Actinomycetota bacterium]